MPLMKRAPATNGSAATPPAESTQKAQQTPAPAVGTSAPDAGSKRLGGMRKAGGKAESTTMSKADWAAKDRRISRQGLFQAALQSSGLLQLNVGNTLEDYLKLVEAAAERGLQFVSKE